MEFKNLLGVRFTRLLVVEYRGLNSSKRRRHTWLCKCDCGALVVTTTQLLRAGQCTSCGCRTREINLAKGTVHGMHATIEYRCWAGAKQRCTNQNSPNWLLYGGRGISMCSRWMDSFELFYSDMGPMADGCSSLDRIDSNGNYEPRNCRWANHLMQSQNMRRNVVVLYDGREMCLSEFARATGISTASVSNWYGRGLSPIQMLARRDANRGKANG